LPEIQEGFLPFCQMETSIEKWAKKRIAEICDFLTAQNIQELVSFGVGLGEEELRDHFSILGDFQDDFVKEWQKRKAPRLAGIWKTKGMDLVDQLKAKLDIPFSDAQSMLDNAKDMDMDSKRRYFQELIGTGFETERFVILFQKMIDKQERDNSITASNTPLNNVEENKRLKSSRRKSKMKKNEFDVKSMKQIGKARPRIENLPICQCMASVHPLASNCLHCGKILCVFEGADRCCWCGRTPQDEHLIKEGYSEAVARSQVLLDYQANSTARTHVHDNAADFDVGADTYNKWVSASEREEARRMVVEKENADEEEKKRRVITLDIENRTMFLESVGVRKGKERKPDLAHTSSEYLDSSSSGLYRNPLLAPGKAPKFVNSNMI